jgi:hypothetical protein
MVPHRAGAVENLIVPNREQLTSTDPYNTTVFVGGLSPLVLLCSPRIYGTQRKIYPCPYTCALIGFLAHPAVRAWLDAMVWSSAQLHNVREMVECVFGTGEGEGKGLILRVMWARDTLGLGREARRGGRGWGGRARSEPESESGRGGRRCCGRLGTFICEVAGEEGPLQPVLGMQKQYLA